MWIRLKNNVILNMDSIVSISKCPSYMNEGTYDINFNCSVKNMYIPVISLKTSDEADAVISKIWEKINSNTNIDLNELA